MSSDSLREYNQRDYRCTPDCPYKTLEGCLLPQIKRPNAEPVDTHNTCQFPGANERTIPKIKIKR